MNTLREAAQQALEAWDSPLGMKDLCVAMEALKAALEQPEQEPVADAMKTVIKAMQDDPDYAWAWHCNVAMAFFDAGGDSYTANQGAARFMRLMANVDPAHELPPHPPRREWKGLTEEEIDIETAESRDALMDFVYEHGTVSEGQQRFIRKMARAIEAALKERNA